MAFFKCLLADRDVFAFIGRGSGRLGEQLYLGIPEDVLLAPPQPFYIWLQGIIVVEGHPLTVDLGGGNGFIGSIF